LIVRYYRSDRILPFEKEFNPQTSQIFFSINYVLLYEEIRLSPICSLYKLDAKLNAVNKQTSFESVLVSAFGQE